MGVLLSLAALIFSGQLAGFVANGIGLLLVGTCLMNIVLALLSSRPAMVGTVQDAPAVVVALIAANIASSVPTGTASSAIYATVVVAIALTTLITGATFLLLGQFRLGSLVSYLPYPVIGGFLAGTGWLLMLGGVGVMTNVPLVQRSGNPFLVLDGRRKTEDSAIRLPSSVLRPANPRRTSADVY